MSDYTYKHIDFAQVVDRIRENWRFGPVITRNDLLTGAAVGGGAIATSYIDNTFILGISISSWGQMVVYSYTLILLLKALGVFVLGVKAFGLIKKLINR